jgi:hypothetical protein
MKRLITITTLVVLLSFEIPSSAQEPAAGGQASPSNQHAPSAQPQAEPTPAPPQTTPSETQTQPQTAPPPTANPPSPTPKSARRKRPAPKGAANHKVVVRNGGANDDSVQLAPGMTKEQELRNREITASLLAGVDANLKNIAGRQLTPAQQGLLDQIHTYMKQSKDASDSGDLARAQTLAYKAHLLSDELRK